MSNVVYVKPQPPGSDRNTRSVQLLVKLYAAIAEQEDIDERIIIEHFISELNLYLKEMLQRA